MLVYVELNTGLKLSIEARIGVVERNLPMIVFTMHHTFRISLPTVSITLVKEWFFNCRSSLRAENLARRCCSLSRLSSGCLTNR